MDDALGLCLGCGRTLFEIARWGTLPEDERHQIMDALPDRMVEINAVLDARAAALAPPSKAEDTAGPTPRRAAR